ncbi:unnamed protein product [Amoebophrya sp. A25]|nr:unnamed protein product [Amoebophrya sp. A25]|eukprot:GSA25T00022749001.1
MLQSLSSRNALFLGAAACVSSLPGVYSEVRQVSLAIDSPLDIGEQDETELLGHGAARFQGLVHKHFAGTRGSTQGTAEATEGHVLQHFGTSAQPRNDVVTRTTHTGVSDEIKSAFGSACAGFLLFLFAFPLLWGNESRQAKMWRLFGRARKIVVSDVAKCDDNNDRRLVHVPGVTSTEDVLKDKEGFGITLNGGCLALTREVEMYQWEEKSESKSQDDNYGGKDTTTTYYYRCVWKSCAIDSSSFQEKAGHENPKFPSEFSGSFDEDNSGVLYAPKVSLKDFRVPKPLLTRLVTATKSKPVVVPGEGARKAAGRTWYTTSSLDSAEKGEWLCTDTSAEPQVGALRVRYTKTECGPCTVLGVQSQNSFVPLEAGFKTDAGDETRVAPGSVPPLEEPLLQKGSADAGVQKIGIEPSDVGQNAGCMTIFCRVCGAVSGFVSNFGTSVFEVSNETLSCKAIFEQAEGAQNSIHTLLQIVGFLMLFGGLQMTFSVVPALFRVIPFVGTWIQLFGNLIATAAAFILGCIFWCTTVALAWFAVRPQYAAALLGGGVCVFAAITAASKLAA